MAFPLNHQKLVTFSRGAAPRNRGSTSNTYLSPTANRLFRWELSLQLLDSMRKEQISPDTVACNACISACASSAQWPMALHLLQLGKKCLSLMNIGVLLGGFGKTKKKMALVHLVV